MKILALDIMNVKRIRVVHIEPDGSVVILGGRNEQGKTSILDGIAMVLGGKDEFTASPLRRGSESGHVIADLGEVIVTRTWKANGADGLKIEAKIDAKTRAAIKSPQAWLDERIGPRLDIMEFFRMGSTAEGQRKQAEILRTLAGVDTREIEARRKALYDERTIVNRQVRDAEGELRNLPTYPDAPEAPVTTESLTAELEVARGVNAAREKALQAAREADRYRLECATKMVQAQTLGERTENEGRAHMELVEAGFVRDQSALDQDVDRSRAEVARLEGLLNLARATVERAVDVRAEFGKQVDVRRAAELGKVNESIMKAEDAYRAILTAAGNAERAARDSMIAAEAMPVADEAAIIAKFQEAEGINRKVAANAARAQADRRVNERKAEAAGLDASIAACDAEKAALLSAAKFPVPGLGFDDAGFVTFNDIPVSEASQAQKIKIGVSMYLAGNPTIRVIPIRDGSNLDRDNLRLIAEMAEERDAQVWIERADRQDAGTIVIEDGCIREDATVAGEEG